VWGTWFEPQDHRRSSSEETGPNTVKRKRGNDQSLFSWSWCSSLTTLWWRQKEESPPSRNVQCAIRKGGNFFLPTKAAKEQRRHRQQWGGKRKKGQPLRPVSGTDEPGGGARSHQPATREKALICVSNKGNPHEGKRERKQQNEGGRGLAQHRSEHLGDKGGGWHDGLGRGKNAGRREDQKNGQGKRGEGAP